MRPTASLLTALLLTACAEVAPRPPPQAESTLLHQQFTFDAVSKLRQGMPLEQVRQMFGEPDTVRSALCGPPNGGWPCLIFEYNMGDFQHNVFYFNMKGKSPWLNHWSIPKTQR